jgi:PhnB protein
MPPHDAFYGDRYSWVADPFGHIWALATVRETLTSQEIEQRMAAHVAQMGGESCDQS